MSKESIPNQILIAGDSIHEMEYISQLVHERIFSVNINRIDLQKAESELKSSRFDIILLVTEHFDINVESLLLLLNKNKIIPVIVISDNTSIVNFQKNVKNKKIDYLSKSELNSLLLFKSMCYSIELSRQHTKHKTLKKRYRDLFYMNPLPMWIYDLEFLRFFQVNDAAVDKYGFSREEYSQMTLKDIRPPEDIVKLEEAVDFAKKNEKLFSNRIYRHQKKDGSIMYVELVSKIINIEKIKYGLVMANDITESLNYIKAIESQNTRLQEITFNYSHIIRAPLANMMGIINMVKEMDPSSPENAELLEYLFTSCNQLDEKINEVIEKSVSYPLTCALKDPSQK